MIEQNPFASYSLEDQNDIADQLRQIKASGQLHPDQLQGVDNALKYLPMSKSQADANLLNLTTLGQGAWKPEPRPQFNPSPEGARRATIAEYLRKNPKDDEEEGGLGDMFINALGKHLPETGATLGGTAASLPFSKGSTAESVAKATGRFAGGIAGDPITWALAGAGGKVLTSGFAFLGAKGSYEAAGQLGEVWDREDIPRDRKIELGVNMTLNAMMAGLGGSHTVKSLMDSMPRNIPVEDRAIIQQKIESEWQQMPNGQMMRRRTSGVSSDVVPDTTVAGGKLSQQFPEGSFYNRQIAKAPAEPPPPVQKTTRNMIRPLDAQAPTGETNLQNVLGRYLIVPNKPPPSPVEASAPPEVAGFARPNAQEYVGRYNTRPPSEPQPPSISGAAPEPPKTPPDFKSQQGVSEQMPAPSSEPTDLEHAMMAFGGDVAGRDVPPSKPTKPLRPQNPARPEADKFSLAEYTKREQQKLNLGKGEIINPEDYPTIEEEEDYFRNFKSNLPERLTIEGTPSRKELPAAPTELTPREKADLIKPDRGGVYDLRAVDSDTRHEWINQNAHLEPRGVTSAADMMREGRKLYGPDRHIGVVSYLDKDGALHHAIKLFKDESGQPVMHVAPDPAPAGESAVSRLSPKGAETFAAIQESETKFNERTGGQHTQVLKDLWSEVEKSLPSDTPAEGKQALYKKGLDALHKALTSGKSLTELYEAFDIVKKRGEAGFLGGSRRRLSPEELDRLTRLHVDSQLSKWEERGVPLPTLTKPAFRAAVYGANDPALELRYEELLKKGGEGTDPIGMLSNVVSGVTNKMLSRDILAEQLSRAAFSREQRVGQLEEYRRDWNSRGIEDTLLYFDATEKGDINSLTDPKDRESAQMLRTMLDQKRDQIRALGTGKLDNFIENYMGRLWKFGVKDVAQQIMSGRRPFAGGASFLKPRTYEYFSDGIAAGMEPVTYNPIDMQIIKLHEMDRYLAAHNWFKEAKSYGLVREFEDTEAPKGWSRLDDNMFRAGEGKNWYAPADVASSINNHLSPGLRSGNKGLLYNPIAHYNNLLNQANLGMSVFHGFETAYYSLAGEVGDIFSKISKGDLAGLGTTAMRWARVDKGGPVAPLRQFLLGNRLLQESLHPGTFAELADDVENLQRAGARLRMPEQYRNNAREALSNAMKELRYKGWKVLGENFGEMLNDNPGVRAMRVGTRLIGATLEQISRPLMEVWVPRIKIGAAAERARDYVARNEDASPEQLRRGLRKIWDAMDDRFGEFTYDNLFMDRAVKDAVHLGVRSFGWNFGTARTFVGSAVPDVFNLRDPESFAGQIANKKYSGLTERQAFTLGLLTTTYLTARALSYFFNQEPDEYTKAGFAKTGGVNPDGSPTRIYVKSYVTDAYSFYHSPGQTTLNKLAPAWHQIGELYNNSDYWGNQIHPIHPTTADALTDPETYTSTAKYLATSAMPFSVTNYQQRRARGEGVLSSLTSGSAVLPAPAWVGQTKAASLAYDLFRTKLPRGPNDAATAARTQRYHQLASGYAAGTVTEKDIDEALDKHVITTKQYDGILAADQTGLKDGEMDTLNRHVKYLEPNEFIRVFDYANDAEKRAMEDRFYQKWDKAVNDGDNDTAKLFEEREKLIHRK